MSLQEKPLPADVSAAALKAALTEREREIEEAREREAATAEVLRVISASPGDLQPVFQAILENATRICDAKFGTLYRFDGRAFYQDAAKDTPEALVEHQKRQGRFFPEEGTLLYRVWRHKALAHSADYAAEPRLGLSAKYGGARSTVAVPMVKEGEILGVVVIYRQEVRPFSDKQIELLQHFAAQAVIAIENVRLLSELRESLSQQTATADVLKAISRETFDLPAVLDTLIASACRLCEADIGTIRYEDGPGYGLAATYGCQPEWHKHFAGYSTKPDRSSVFGQTILKGSTVHIPDVLEDPDYSRPEAQKLMNLRAALGVPLLRDGRVFGVVNLFRSTPRPFTQKQIELAETFADQAVIAIENVRLFEAEQQRSAELAESLSQQTATADVLKVISHSAFDLQTVLQTLAESAARLCEAYDSGLFLRHGDKLQTKAHYGSIEWDFAEWPISRDWVTGRAFVERKPVHVDDLSTAEEFPEGRAMALRMGHRTILAVPLLREDDAIGAITIRRREIKPFTDKQIELVKTFADQAVIAIENVRLFDEVQARTAELTESLAQQTATSEVLEVISSSPGELEPVFDAMLGERHAHLRGKIGRLVPVRRGRLPGGRRQRPIRVRGLVPARSCRRPARQRADRHAAREAGARQGCAPFPRPARPRRLSRRQSADEGAGRICRGADPSRGADAQG